MTESTYLYERILDGWTREGCGCTRNRWMRYDSVYHKSVNDVSDCKDETHVDGV